MVFTPKKPPQKNKTHLFSPAFKEHKNLRGIFQLKYLYLGGRECRCIYFRANRMCNLGQAVVISIMKACSLKSPLTERRQLLCAL